MTESPQIQPSPAGQHTAARTAEPVTAEREPGLERLVFFSDAVIAIAMTLLALELPVPEGDSSRAL